MYSKFVYSKDGQFSMNFHDNSKKKKSDFFFYFCFPDFSFHSHRLPRWVHRRLVPSLWVPDSPRGDHWLGTQNARVRGHGDWQCSISQQVGVNNIFVRIKILLFDIIIIKELIILYYHYLGTYYLITYKIDKGHCGKLFYWD